MFYHEYTKSKIFKQLKATILYLFASKYKWAAFLIYNMLKIKQVQSLWFHTLSLLMH